VPFHVEIGSSFNHARVFNLEEAELRRSVLEPWVAGVAFEFEEREWEPRDSRLTILEGPRLAAADLSFGQGWSNATRSAEDVTRRLVAAARSAAPVRNAAVIEAHSLEAALAGLAAGQPISPLSWEAAAKRVDGRDPEVAAVILVLRKPER
jgi:MoxR-like ATPase